MTVREPVFRAHDYPGLRIFCACPLLLTEVVCLAVGFRNKLC